MCGRFILTSDGKILRDLFGLADVIELHPSYNIAPSTNIAAVRVLPGGEGRQLDWLRWGLLPSWAKDIKFGFRTINARSETAATKPAYRAAFKRRRCLIPADGFYEWTTVAKGQKQPHLIRLKSQKPFAMAGLWETWVDPEGETSDGEIIESCTILTTEANELVAKLHQRMPVILDQPTFDAWLDPLLFDRDVVQALLQPYPAELMTFFEVSRLVNNVRNNDPTCIEPAAVTMPIDFG